MSGALFPAWRPDAAGRERLGGLAAALHAARPAGGPRLQSRRADQWHATLCFIGHDAIHLATPALLDALAAAARRIPAHAFEVERIAYWPQSGAVVALPAECPALEALCEAVGETLRACNIPGLEVTTRPHVTLAYLERHLPAQPWLDGIDCAGDPLAVEAFELLVTRGGGYEALAAWTLAGSAPPRPPAQAALF